MFKNEQLAVWEYVSNGLQYVDPGVNPVVHVRLDEKRRRITIDDNGRGMSFVDLQNFFVMHGENVDRKAGRVGRGIFGTGKSAAFGIADTLIVTTVRAGRRTKVSLSRADIRKMSDDAPIPVAVREREVVTAEPNGTRVEIAEIHLRRLDQRRVITFIERHLAHWSRHVTVSVNSHECHYSAPVAIRTEDITPDGTVAAKLGACRLLLRVAATPLSEDERGIAIYANGVWHETTLAGSDGREMASYIFGELDVPALDTDSSPIAPFDMSRSMQLNPANELVQAILGFVSAHVERLRRDLVAKERERRASEDARRLERQAHEIARVINEDFSDFAQRVARARAKSHGGNDLGRSGPSGDDSEDDLVFGGDLFAELVARTGAAGADGDGDGDGGEPRDVHPAVQPGDDDAPRQGKPVGGQEPSRQRPRGGFSIDFRHMGEPEDRAKYHRDERQIVVNLDHPQFRAALGVGTIEDAAFRRLAYEVAFLEYALALAWELAQRGEYLDVTAPVEDIGATINRVARRAASLYEAP